MTERTLIPCPICHGSTKEIQGVLCCITKCKTQFWGLDQTRWYACTPEELVAANEKIKALEKLVENQAKILNTNLDSAVMKRIADIAWDRAVSKVRSDRTTPNEIPEEEMEAVVLMAISELAWEARREKPV